MRWSNYLAALPSEHAHAQVNALTTLCGRLALAARSVDVSPTDAMLGMLALIYADAVALEDSLATVVPPLDEQPPVVHAGSLPEAVLAATTAARRLAGDVLGDRDTARVQGEIARIQMALTDARGCLVGAATEEPEDDSWNSVGDMLVVGVIAIWVAEARLAATLSRGYGVLRRSHHMIGQSQAVLLAGQARCRPRE